MNQTNPETDIASMLDSIEEAIDADIDWSSVPPPPAETEMESLFVDVEAAANETEPSSGEAAEKAFEGISCELRVYPDARPRPAGVGARVRGSTRDVMAGFRWGGT
jgi:hypothetical protein